MTVHGLDVEEHLPSVLASNPASILKHNRPKNGIPRVSFTVKRFSLHPHGHGELIRGSSTSVIIPSLSPYVRLREIGADTQTFISLEFSI